MAIFLCRVLTVKEICHAMNFTWYWPLQGHNCIHIAERPWNESLSSKIAKVQESFKNIPSMLYFSPSSVSFDGVGVYTAEALPQGTSHWVKHHSVHGPGVPCIWKLLQLHKIFCDGHNCNSKWSLYYCMHANKILCCCCRWLSHVNPMDIATGTMLGPYFGRTVRREQIEDHGNCEWLWEVCKLEWVSVLYVIAFCGINTLSIV